METSKRTECREVGPPTLESLLEEQPLIFSSGANYYFAEILLILSGFLESSLGNTLPSVVFLGTSPSSLPPSLKPTNNRYTRIRRALPDLRRNRPTLLRRHLLLHRSHLRLPNPDAYFPRLLRLLPHFHVAPFPSLPNLLPAHEPCLRPRLHLRHTRLRWRGCPILDFG
jgi:hypothetical protein